jgi:DNA-binding transcriptional MerR regulator
MAELSADTGVPVPTIKYYLREGLLPPGRPVGRNQAEYGDGHVRRLKMIRALVEHGGLSIAAVRDLVRHLDDPDVSGGDLLGVAQLSITPEQEPPQGPDRDAAERVVADLMRRHGWCGFEKHPARRALVGVLTSLGALGREDMLSVLDDYATAAEQVARADLRVVGDLADRERALEVVVLGTRLGDTILAALRKLAQAHVSEGLYGPVRHPDPESEDEPGDGSGDASEGEPDRQSRDEARG